MIVVASEIMSCLLTLAILLLTSNNTECGAVEEISLIKNLLTTIFNRYKTDMTSLQEVVEMTTGDLNR